MPKGTSNKKHENWFSVGKTCGGQNNEGKMNEIDTQSVTINHITKRKRDQKKKGRQWDKSETGTLMEGSGNW